MGERLNEHDVDQIELMSLRAEIEHLLAQNAGLDTIDTPQDPEASSIAFGSFVSVTPADGMDGRHTVQILEVAEIGNLIAVGLFGFEESEGGELDEVLYIGALLGRIRSGDLILLGVDEAEQKLLGDVLRSGSFVSAHNNSQYAQYHELLSDHVRNIIRLVPLESLRHEIDEQVVARRGLARIKLLLNKILRINEGN